MRRVAGHEPLERQYVDITPRVLVVGGGIAGIQAALTLANAGKQVILVEREPTIGGHMAMFDKTFPDARLRRLHPHAQDDRGQGSPEHHAADLLRGRAGRRLGGQLPGQGPASRPLHQRGRSASAAWSASTPASSSKPKFDNEFDQGLGKRKPVYMPFPQAVPPVPVIDPEACLELKTGKCKQTCVEACGDRNAIDFDQQE